MRSSLSAPALVALVAFGLSSAGCQPEEHAILIEARSQGDVYTLQVDVLFVGDRRIHHTDPRPVNRTKDDIEHGEPIRIAVDLGRAAYVLVHARAVDRTGQQLVGNQCFHVDGVVHGSMLLVYLSSALDPDGDGFPVDASRACYEADGSPCLHECGTTAADCRDCAGGACTPGCDVERPPASCESASSPVATDYCEDGVDQDCSGSDAPCQDADGDGFQVCRRPDEPECDCDDLVAAIHPHADDQCRNGIDEDCDGSDGACDNDGDGYRANADVGGFPDCDDTNPQIHPMAPEICDAHDNDCNGRTDESAECVGEDLDRDGEPYPGDCDDCNPGRSHSFRELCGNGVDEDCSGVDEPCAGGDADRDGVAALAAGGTDCDDANPNAYPGAPEACGNAIDENCNGMDDSCADDLDGDGWVESSRCEMDPTPEQPGTPDECNGVDDDCDGIVDEVLDPNRGCVFDETRIPGCAAMSCSVDYLTTIEHCGGCRMECPIDRADRCQQGACDCLSAGAETDPAAACVAGEWCCSSSRGEMPIGCRNLQTDAHACGSCNVDCTAMEQTADTCDAGTCVCGGTGAQCSGYPQLCCGTAPASFCTNVLTDVNNCGACGHACNVPNATAQCVDGQCTVATCNGSFQDCDGDAGERSGCETDLATSLSHCGSCANDCSSGQTANVCSASSCLCGTGRQCAGDPELCCGAGAAGRCTDISSDVTNCGACGTTCSFANATPLCSARICRLGPCNGGTGNCDSSEATGCETNTTNNASHCGGCGNVCPTRPNSSPTCSSSTCTIACSGGYDNCDGGDSNGCETQTSSDVDACGSCTTVCGSHANSSRTCTAGRCGYTCSSGWGDCTTADGCETNLNTDPSHCGSCPTNCPSHANSTRTCSSGTCGYNCNNGFDDCSGADGCETVLNSDTSCGSGCGAVENCTTMTPARVCCPSGPTWACRNGC